MFLHLLSVLFWNFLDIFRTYLHQLIRWELWSVLWTFAEFVKHDARNKVCACIFFNYINSFHENIKFPSKDETNNKVSFLDIDISRNKNQFITSVFHKPRFSGVFSYFDSFISRGYKFSLVSTFISVAILFVVVWNFSIKRLCNFKIFLKRMDKTINILAGASNIYKQNWF